MNQDRDEREGDDVGTSGSAEELRTQVEHHLAGEHEREGALLQVCRQVMLGSVGLHHLAYYTDRVLDFTLDHLEAGEIPESRPRDTTRAGLRRMGRQLCAAFEQWDRSLRDAYTGALIRTVIRTDDAEIVCDPVVRAQYVVGVTYTGDRDEYIDDANDVDRSVAQLIIRLRAEVGLRSQNLGGYDPRTIEVAPADPAAPHVTVRSPIPPEVQEACTNALNAADLHLVAYCVDDEVAFLVDMFDEAALRLYFTGSITPSYRRTYYRAFCGQLAETRAQLNRMTAVVLRGRLKRVVLDVEQGAVYYYRVTGRVYLVGVTLHQPQVHDADVRMAQLADECRRHHSTV